MTAWWTETQAAWIGGLGGDGLGAVVGIFGGMAGMLAPRGKCRGLIVGGMTTFALLGVVSLIAGIIAVVGHQPYMVWYPLMLVGVILATVCGCLLPVVKMRYRQAEARKMDAEGIRRT